MRWARCAGKTKADEAQTLPAHLLDPILDALQELCTNYGASVVLSTATQPAYKAVAIFARVQAREIVPKPQRFPLEEFILFDLNPERLLAVLRRGSGRRS